MFIIGEKINGTFSKVTEAIKNKDKKYIQDLALKQIQAGADSLDISSGPAFQNQADTVMEWLVKTVIEVTDVPLCIDNPVPLVIEAGLKCCKGPAIINSTSAEKSKLEALTDLALKYNSSLIALVMNEAGVPQDIDSRTALALEILSYTSEKGLSTENLYLDPLILPLNVAQDKIKDTLETIRNFQILSDPAPKIIVGLSNVSQQAKYRPIINRTFMTMAMEAGLSAVILNPLDKELMQTIKTAKFLLNQEIYYPDFLEN